MFSRTKLATALVALGLGLCGSGVGLADEGHSDRDHSGQIPHLDHVFVIMMENHGYQQVINNPNMPYLNGAIASHQVTLATNYFAVAHPSLTNYLEITGGSNFGILSDNPPNWHSNCEANIATGLTNADNAGPGTPNIPLDLASSICPITGTGHDTAVVAVDTWNETNPPVFNYVANIDGLKSIPSITVQGKSIADQLVAAGKTWKTYQESLPFAGADLVNYSNGTLTNLDKADFNSLNSAEFPSGVPLVQAYAAKHNPFVYFASVQAGTDPRLSLSQVVGFAGDNGLFADLASGTVPTYSYIVPNQCDDQHGQGAGDQFCQYDPGEEAYDGNTAGTQAGLNAALIRQGDATLQRLVTGIKSSPAWAQGRNAIVIVWDENDYSGVATYTSGAFPAQNQNNVVLTVETNYQSHGTQSGTYYNHYALLKTIETGLGLPCLNHACDANVAVMSDLFAER
jgi:hypothetical protein